MAHPFYSLLVLVEDVRREAGAHLGILEGRGLESWREDRRLGQETRGGRWQVSWGLIVHLDCLTYSPLRYEMKSMTAAEQSDHMAIPSKRFTRRRMTPTMATAASIQGVSSGRSSNPSGCMLQSIRGWGELTPVEGEGWKSQPIRNTGHPGPVLRTRQALPAG